MELDLNVLRPQERTALQLRLLYEREGFQKYHMGRFEEYGLYQENRRFLSSEQVITFTDLDGRLLALKPDVTLSIAKNAQVAPGGCGRYYYQENVYRPSQESHTFREISQMGLECIGAVDADAAAQELAALEEESMSEPAMAAASDGEELPNIIVIMDEAFSDPAILGDFTVNQDYMPFVHSLLDGAENTVSGWLNVSVLGGNTANTEFEYLTGNTMAFLPQGSIPYQQYIKGETPSLASHLAGLGYQTVAMHPYNASGWDRDTVYPAMGFSEMYFLPDFDNAAKVRNYVSDQSDFEKIVEIYENKGDNPLFLFNVTMQNHSSYTESFDNFDPQIEVEGGSQTLNNYLSLLSLSDAALGELISYFEEQEEDTIIVFFGDHQTTNSVIEPILKQNGKSSSTLTEEEQADRYKVPFFIWANFDIEEETGVETSVNYLGAKTLLAAGVPMDGYFTYLSVFSETVPVISANHVTLADGTFTNADDQSELLSDYKGYQYYRLFDYSAD